MTKIGPWLVFVTMVVVGVGMEYGGYRLYQLSQDLDKATFQNRQLVGALTRTKKDNSDLSDALYAEQQKNNSFEDQIKNIAGTVGNLEKLSKTDRELLRKYSRVYFLSENYVPEKLAYIATSSLFSKDKTLQIHASVAPFLGRMLAAAKEDGITIKVNSAYRSFGTQSALKSAYLVRYGTGSNQFSADQGYSEHQLGTTVDLATASTSFSYFEKTTAYAWLKANAHRYGFTLSYPERNSYYQYEPWHWRFVGVALARRLHDENKYFYDLSQRDIDQYLISIFD